MPGTDKWIDRVRRGFTGNEPGPPATFKRWYHVTPTTNLSSILSSGLLSGMGTDDLEQAEFGFAHAMLSGTPQKPDGHDSVTILEIHVPDSLGVWVDPARGGTPLHGQIEVGTGIYAGVMPKNVPPEWIRVVKELKKDDYEFSEPVSLSLEVP